MLTKLLAAAHDSSESGILSDVDFPVGAEALAPARRRRQLAHAEERLRPLRDTHLARVYWRVHDELRRLERDGLSTRPPTSP
jgi:hypothetical protein